MFDRFYMGVCYYPEHWPANRHESDFRRMKENGIDLVRMGEGAWNYWEPAEGKFQFELFDRAIAFCRKFDIRVILGTPTYCGPAWIASQYPEVLRWDFNRQVMAHGSRRNYNYTSPKYLELSDRICTALAEHYRDCPEVIGWQLDNEFNCHMDVSYAPSDTIVFRAWLQNKYKTIARLNDAWGTNFWAQTYDNWEQIDLPHPTATYLNPTQLLDESRFISECVVRFARRQATILRKHNKRWKITHNALFKNIDGPKLVEELDFFCHDQYPLFWNDGHGRAEPLIQTRSLSFPFGILEQQAGPGGQMSYLQRTPRPGELKLWAWQSVAHGAKLVSFFRWRTCPYGSEQHWHGLLDYDNKDNRRLAEAKLFAEEVAVLPPAFFDAPVLKAVAVLRDFDNEVNERRVDTFTKSGAGEHARWLVAMSRRHVPVDYVWPESDLTGYSVLIVPHQQIVNSAVAGRLRDFVEAGGLLVLGAMSGLKDENIHMVEKTAPGILAKLAGIEVEDWTILAERETRRAVMDDGTEISLGTFVERLRLRGARAVAKWSGNDGLLGSAPAISHNRVGKGSVVYIGGFIPDEAINLLAAKVCELASLQPTIDAGDPIEAIIRVDRKQRYLVLLNHGESKLRITVPAGYRPLSGDASDDREIEFDAYDVKVLVKENSGRSTKRRSVVQKKR